MGRDFEEESDVLFQQMRANYPAKVIDITMSSFVHKDSKVCDIHDTTHITLFVDFKSIPDSTQFNLTYRHSPLREVSPSKTTAENTFPCRL